jgi:FkbM family methyltransferase
MGLNWNLDLSDNHQRRLYFAGSYERSTLEAARRVLVPGDTVLDVGANIGTFALAMAQWGCRVVAVEAASDTVERLRRHVESNGLLDRVQIVQSALGAKKGSITLRCGSTPSDSGLRTVTGEGRALEEVEMETGDALLARLGIVPTLIKVDVEGGELSVLQGLVKSLGQVSALVIEMVPSHLDRAGTAADDITSLLGAVGFKPLAIRARGLTPWSGQAGNVLFLRSDARSSAVR